MTTKLDVQSLAALFENGYCNLYANEQAVNDLNVFPVPDGDTGTNMVRTLEGGLNISGETVSSYMQKLSRGVLLSARGNSGVILSQFIRGVAEGVADESALSVPAFISALESGVQSAYGAVIEPTEGTMLTVIREGIEAVAKKKFADFEALFQFLIEAMKQSLAHTPELLPVLKEANVVDSGGVGMVSFFEGMLLKLQGITLQPGENTKATQVSYSAAAFGPDSVLEYGYCTEFILQLMHAKTNIKTFELQPMIDYLESIGNSIVAVQDKDIVKVHVHTFTPEKALGFARNFGEFITVKIENMSVQHNETTERKEVPAERVKYAVVAVASGSGLKEYFSEIGATVVIDGGQTQNPSAEDFVSAFKSLNAEHIIVLPNNSNIVMTAELARDMYSEADVRVIPTKSIAAGYSALTMMNPWLDNIDDFVEEMENGACAVSSISVAQAVHNADLHGMHIDKDAYMGILDGKICCTEQDAVSAAVSAVKNTPSIEEKEVMTIFYGQDITEQQAQELQSAVQELFPRMEYGVVYGGQKVYEFYIAVE